MVITSGGSNDYHADLSRADLRVADLRDANLRDANLRGIQVEKTRFRNNLGITEELKKDLINRGAIFEDSPGDHRSFLNSATNSKI